MEKFYLDTSIWIDYYLKRDKNGEVAKNLIKKIIFNKKTIVYSTLTIKELKHLGYMENEIKEILSLSAKRIFIQVSKEQFNEAKRIAKQRDIPVGDVINAIISRDNEAQLVSNDLHFQRLKDITKVKTPLELI